MTMMTATAAYAHFGATLANPRWAWAGQGQGIVAISVWKDSKHLFRNPDGKIVYSCVGPHLDDRMSKNGWRDRTQKIQYAIEHCDSLVRVVWEEAEDATAEPRKTIWRQPDDTLWLLIVYFNAETGEFIAVEV